jgi:2-polyprenyl-3-methyl-5-hydroxy-6-metoxy-1,4-benzoquinol methylase
LVRPGGKILDAGCGSGRDSLAFLERGYDVTAIDASARLGALASKLLDRPVLQMTFQEIAWRQEFDGIWASASLLHVPRSEIDDVLGRLARALKPGGAMFLSFKHGNREGERNGRWFNSYDEAAFHDLLGLQPMLELVRVWLNEDTRPEQAGEWWLNAVLTRR